MNSLSICILLLLSIILFWQIKLSPGKTFFDNSFSLSVSKGIQGFFGLLIIIHHVYTFLDSRRLPVEELSVFKHMGVYYIGFYFFCSGYGLILSLHTKKDYLKGFLVRRFPMVLVPFFICNYAYMSVELLLGESFSMPELVAAFLGFLLLNSQMWFAVEIMLLYLIFFLLFSGLKSEKICVAIIALFIAIFTVFSMLGRHPATLSNWFWGEWWYNATPLFLAGMIVAYHKKQIKDFVTAHYLVSILTALTGFVLFTILSNHILNVRGYWTGVFLHKVEAYIFQVPSIMFFVMLVLLLLMKVRFHNAFLEFLGMFSLEIILVNGVFLESLKGVAIRYGIVSYLCLTVAGTFVAAVCLSRLKGHILEIK